MSVARRQARINSRLKGSLLAAMAFLVFSPETLLIRLVSTDPWTIMFWRGFLGAMGLALLVLLGSGTRNPDRRFAGVRWGLPVVILMAASQMLFVTSVTRTVAANTLVIIATAPLSAAVMSRLFLKEPVLPHTWLAAGVIAASALLIIWEGVSSGTLPGDLAAVLASLGLSGTLVLLRRARDVNMMPAMAMAALLASLLSLPLSHPIPIAPADVRHLALIGLVLHPIGIMLLALAPKFASAAEVGLVVPLEAVFGPLWVWLFLGEVPSPKTIAAGAVIILTVTLHSVLVEVMTRRDPGPLRT